MTKKKFAELELSPLHLQQNVEIPENHLIIHPVIQRTVEQVIHCVLFLNLIILNSGFAPVVCIPIWYPGAGFSNSISSICVDGQLPRP